MIVLDRPTKALSRTKSHSPARGFTSPGPSHFVRPDHSVYQERTSTPSALMGIVPTTSFGLSGTRSCGQASGPTSPRRATRPIILPAKHTCVRAHTHWPNFVRSIRNAPPQTRGFPFRSIRNASLRLAKNLIRSIRNAQPQTRRFPFRSIRNAPPATRQKSLSVYQERSAANPQISFSVYQERPPATRQKPLSVYQERSAANPQNFLSVYRERSLRKPQNSYTVYQEHLRSIRNGSSVYQERIDGLSGTDLRSIRNAPLPETCAQRRSRALDRGSNLFNPFNLFN